MRELPSSFRARLFGAGLPDAGAEVQGRFVGVRLDIDGSRPISVPVHDLSAAIGGFAHEFVFLSFREGGQNFTLQPDGPEDFAVIRKHADPQLTARLRKLGGNVSWQRWIWRTLIGVGVALLVAALLLVVRYDEVVAWTADQVPLETENRLGEFVIDSLRTRDGLLEQGPAVQAVAHIGSRLTEGSRYEYRWIVAQDDQVNAFAAPGGVVVVNSGLILAVGSAEELAGVLAHEIQHVELRHSLQNMIHALGWAAVLTVTLGDVSAIAGVLIHQLGAMSFSRDLEIEADEKGVLALQRAGISSTGMLAFFRRLELQDKGSIPLLSSHPATAERVARLEQMVEAAPAMQPERLALDWAAVQASVRELAPDGTAAR
ncbi:MAG: M48 family metallopeptidase [Panacagrimonas sp.]